jgi:hypothetical protein
VDVPGPVLLLGSGSGRVDGCGPHGGQHDDRDRRLVQQSEQAFRGTAAIRLGEQPVGVVQPDHRGTGEHVGLKTAAHAGGRLRGQQLPVGHADHHCFPDRPGLAGAGVPAHDDHACALAGQRAQVAAEFTVVVPFNVGGSIVRVLSDVALARFS